MKKELWILLKLELIIKKGTAETAPFKCGIIKYLLAYG